MPNDPSVSSLQLRNRVNEALDDFRSLRWRVAAAGLVALVAIVGYGLSRDADQAQHNVEESGPIPSYVTSTTAPVATVKESIVYVVGAVAAPGLYSLQSDARIGDAIEAAGGLLSVADAPRLNLAAKVTDGQRIYVVSQGEQVPSALGDGSSTPADGSDTNPLVNINDANESQLDELPGVGPATAKAIVQFRTSHGPFTSLDDLAKVKGIGPSKLEQMKPQATL